MLWIRHRHLYFSPNFSVFFLIFYINTRQILDKRPRTCATHGIHVAVHTPRSQVPPSLTWLMRHQPALITCLQSRPCFWTRGPRPLSIVLTISVPFRYHTTIVNSPIGPRTHLASPLLSPHCFSFDPQPVSPLSFYGSSIVLTNPFVPHTDNGSHVALLFCTVYKHPL